MAAFGVAVTPRTSSEERDLEVNRLLDLAGEADRLGNPALKETLLLRAGRVATFGAVEAAPDSRALPPAIEI